MTARDFVIAHLSDPHVFVASALRPHYLLDKRLTGTVNALANRRRHYRWSITEAALGALARLAPDHLVITGDITTMGAGAELEKLRCALARLPLGSDRITVLPGNHDAYVRRVVERGAFRTAFGAFQRADPPFDGQRWPLVRLRGPVALIGCDTSHPSAPLMAVGTLGPGQLARLEATLADPRVANRFRVVALHHAPQPDACTWHNRLTDAEAFRQVLARQGAELVLHGHLHLDLRAELPGPRGPIPVRGVPSASSARSNPDRRAAFHLYRVDYGGARATGIRSETWRFVSPEGGFQPVP